MSNWYLYYRLLRAIPDGGSLGLSIARMELQDVLIDLRGKAVKEWPGATDQDIQDFFEYLARNPTVFSEPAARHLASIEGWIHQVEIHASDRHGWGPWISQFGDSQRIRVCACGCAEIKVLSAHASDEFPKDDKE